MDKKLHLLIEAECQTRQAGNTKRRMNINLSRDLMDFPKAPAVLGIAA
jgi:hypothetical protein